MSFTCRLDGGSWTPCGTAPHSGFASYGNLAPGKHVLSVFASSNTARSAVTTFRWRYAGGAEATAARSLENGRPTGRDGQGRPHRTWTPRLGPYRAGKQTTPAAAIVFPARYGIYSAASADSWETWRSGCARPGFCGVAAAGSKPLASVSISLRRSAGGRCWDGAADFDQPCPHWLPATGTRSWKRAFAIEAFSDDGVYILRALAVDRAGRSASDQASFRIDRTAPPAPVISGLDESGDSGTVHLGGRPGVLFACALDGAAYVPCGPSFSYGDLAYGRHRLCVVAHDTAGNTSAPACYEWTVTGESGGGDEATGTVTGTGAVFGISGTPLVGRQLFPGGPDVSINLIFTNPGTAPITVTSAAVDVTGASDPGCSLANFAASKNLETAPVVVVVPPGSTRSLADLGVPESQWPALRMLENGTPQDPCRGASVTLSFSGTGSGA